MVLSNNTNKLIHETSPYLLQHSNNPVDWYPWCDEAFEKATSEDKPIFLSIGYSTCHWCHVMERESFEDNEVAKFLNANFISIKVDREERPDVDTVYMKVCQMLTGSGGWPLSIFLTPDKKPFYAGTYFPKKNMYGRIGFLELLEQISSKWISDRDTIINSSDKLSAMIIYENIPSEIPSEDILNITFINFKERFDSKYGGFSHSPKFPTPHNFLYLMEYGTKMNNQTAIDLSLSSLDSIFKGGIYDHIGGGFARYSTDNKWLVPHFEKMLYDNALLIKAYTNAWLLTKKTYYKIVVEETIEWVKREMTHPEGGFYSALDADSEGEEGKYYIWSFNEIKSLLNNDIDAFFIELYDITQGGNFEGNNIPNLINKEIDTIFSDLELVNNINTIKMKLLDYRNNRIPPHKDDKILTSWNGLMISALTYAGTAFDRKDYVEMATKAATFITNNLIDNNGRLYISYRETRSNQKGFLDDYSFFVMSLIDLYEKTLNISWLTKAIELTENMVQLFKDNENGGFYLYGNDSEQLILRPKEAYDGAIPSGNSVAAMNLLKLAHLTERTEFMSEFESVVKSFANEIVEYPIYYTNMLIALLNYYKPSANIIITGKLNEPSVTKFLSKLFKEPFSYTTLLLNDGSKELLNINNNLISNVRLNEKPTFYICRNFSCETPENDYNLALKTVIER